MFKWLLIFTLGMYGYSPTQDVVTEVDKNLFDQATNVVVGKIVAVEINRDDQDPDWDLRDFQYDLLVEAVEKGNLNRHRRVSVCAVNIYIHSKLYRIK